MAYQIYVTSHAAESAKKFHPDIRKDIKAGLKALMKNPYKGKPLQQELQGFYSIRVGRYRAIYTVKADLKRIEIWQSVTEKILRIIQRVCFKMARLMVFIETK